MMQARCLRSSLETKLCSQAHAAVALRGAGANVNWLLPDSALEIRTKGRQIADRRSFVRVIEEV